jgi:DNA gyrase subunit B
MSPQKSDPARIAFPGAYTADDVEVLSTFEHIRRHPAMYVGDTGTFGLFQLVRGLVENALAAARDSAANRIGVEFLTAGGCVVRDDGRGVSVEPLGPGHPTYLEVMFGGPVYVPGTSDMLNGQVASALSVRLRVETRRDGRLWSQEYRRGQAVTPLTSVEPAGPSGTTVAFWPDPTIFGGTTFDRGALTEWLHERAFLTPGLTVEVADHIEGTRATFREPDGLVGLFRTIRPAEPVHPTPIHLRAHVGEVRAEAVVQWTDGEDELIRGFANGELTREGGTHVDGLRHGLGRALLRLLGETGERQTPLAARCAGLTGAVAVTVTRPVFPGPTRGRLANPEVEAVLRQAACSGLLAFATERPEEARAILDHVRARA